MSKELTIPQIIGIYQELHSGELSNDQKAALTMRLQDHLEAIKEDWSSSDDDD